MLAVFIDGTNRKLNKIRKENKMKTIKIKKIKITDDFKAYPPKEEKMKIKYRAYIKTGMLLPITINKKRELIDGYTQFLLAKMFDINEVEVEIR